MPDPVPRELAMFPLGTVLLPGELMPLHVFEQRYRVMVAELLGEADARPATAAGEFAVVLIERGHEVGGGDTRFATGCLARVVRSERAAAGRYALVVVGIAPITVARWLDDDPYPRALVVESVESMESVESVESVESGESGESGERAALAEQLAAAAARVRERAHALAAAAGGVLDPSGLPAEPDALVHRVASGFGVGPLDRQQLLEAPGVLARLDRLGDLLDDAVTVAKLHREGPGPQ